MKKLLVTLAVAITGAVQAFALTPTAIRENARFLTDRMAYELNLTPQQIEDCYEINYDFIASINPINDGGPVPGIHVAGLFLPPRLYVCRQLVVPHLRHLHEPSVLLL